MAKSQTPEKKPEVVPDKHEQEGRGLVDGKPQVNTDREKERKRRRKEQSDETKT